MVQAGDEAGKASFAETSTPPFCLYRVTPKAFGSQDA
jgi:hypothetical protein